MCQLEGSDHGGRESAAELALAGGIDVNVGRLLQPADFGVSPTRRGNYTPTKLSVNGFLQAWYLFHVVAELSVFGSRKRVFIGI
ncbi:MAG TPA: hypothetical protein DC054_10760 [Blastocatellia bacterium]|nr:hypothetical protein [Blastocatellia bacterium]